MTDKATDELLPCPLCKTQPERFFVGGQRIEVIACVKGCRPNWNSFVVHIRSVDIEDEWGDLGAAWNTIEVYHDETGMRRVRFDRYPKGYVKPEPDGPHLKWSPAISARRAAALQDGGTP
jgi:hypothetical protein